MTGVEKAFASGMGMLMVLASTVDGQMTLPKCTPAVQTQAFFNLLAFNDMDSGTVRDLTANAPRLLDIAKLMLPSSMDSATRKTWMILSGRFVESPSDCAGLRNISPLSQELLTDSAATRHTSAALQQMDVICNQILLCLESVVAHTALCTCGCPCECPVALGFPALSSNCMEFMNRCRDRMSLVTLRVHEVFAVALAATDAAAVGVEDWAVARAAWMDAVETVSSLHNVTHCLKTMWHGLLYLKHTLCVTDRDASADQDAPADQGTQLTCRILQMQARAWFSRTRTLRVRTDRKGFMPIVSKVHRNTTLPFDHGYGFDFIWFNEITVLHRLAAVLMLGNHSLNVEKWSAASIGLLSLMGWWTLIPDGFANVEDFGQHVHCWMLRQSQDELWAHLRHRCATWRRNTLMKGEPKDLMWWHRARLMLDLMALHKAVPGSWVESAALDFFMNTRQLSKMRKIMKVVNGEILSETTGGSRLKLKDIGRRLGCLPADSSTSVPACRAEGKSTDNSGFWCSPVLKHAFGSGFELSTLQFPQVICRPLSSRCEEVARQETREPAACETMQQAEKDAPAEGADTPASRALLLSSNVSFTSVNVFCDSFMQQMIPPFPSSIFASPTKPSCDAMVGTSTKFPQDLMFGTPDKHADGGRASCPTPNTPSSCFLRGGNVRMRSTGNLDLLSDEAEKELIKRSRSRTGTDTVWKRIVSWH
jgi:hypothetical protein